MQNPRAALPKVYVVVYGHVVSVLRQLFLTGQKHMLVQRWSFLLLLSGTRCCLVH